MNITPRKLYDILFKHFGNLNWWPTDNNYHKKEKSDPRFEVIVGAILTQNAAWSNVEKALENLKSRRLLDIKKISEIDIKILQNIVKPTGFFNQKAKRIKNLAGYINNNYSGDLESFLKRNLKNVREELLLLNGIGPETADSILLYAGYLPIFVVDAYTRRICKRLPIDINPTYEDIQDFFQKDLQKKYKKNELSKIYNELHALIVNLAKTYCKSRPECTECPLKEICLYKKKLIQ